MKNIIKKVAIGMLMAFVVFWQSKAMNSDDGQADESPTYAASGASVCDQKALSPLVPLKLAACSQTFKKISADWDGSEIVRSSSLWPDLVNIEVSLSKKARNKTLLPLLNNHNGSNLFRLTSQTSNQNSSLDIIKTKQTNTTFTQIVASLKGVFLQSISNGVLPYLGGINTITIINPSNATINISVGNDALLLGVAGCCTISSLYLLYLMS